MARQVEARLTLASGSEDTAPDLRVAIEEMLFEGWLRVLTGWEVRIVDDVDVET